MILVVATAPNGPSGFFNVADRETVSWSEYYRALAGRLGYGPTAVRLSPERKLRLSVGLVVEWCSQQRPIIKTAKNLPKLLMDIIKSILQKRTLTKPTPYAHMGGRPAGRLYLSRKTWELQNTVRKLPADKIFRDYGKIDLVPFDQAVATTATWLRFAGFAPLPVLSMPASKAR